jgi:alpha-beta hydrolase superfamily lysophospholipase
VDVAWYTKIAIAVSNLMQPQRQFKLPIEPEMFTTEPFYLDYIKADPLRNSTASASFLMNSRGMDNYLADHIQSSKAPILLFLAGQDRIIDNEAVLVMIKQAQADPLKVVNYPEQTHSIQFDNTEKMVAEIDHWIQSRQSEQP